MTTREQIIAAAKEAGFPEWENTDDPEFLKVIEKLYVVAFQSGAASRDAEIEVLQSNQANVEETHKLTLREVQRELMRLQTENDQLRAMKEQP